MIVFMFNNHSIIHRVSIVIMGAFVLLLGYISFEGFIFTKEHKIGINGEIYTNRVSTKPYIKELSNQLIEECQSDLCRVQKILDYVTNIEYKINPTIAKSPKDTIELGYGDCDDKTNLLASLLKVQGYEVLFVTVPKHIFTLISLDDRKLSHLKGLYLDGKKYYILESTAKNSQIGFPLQYKMEDIEVIIEPFLNQKLRFEEIEYKR